MTSFNDYSMLWDCCLGDNNSIWPLGTCFSYLASNVLSRRCWQCTTWRNWRRWTKNQALCVCTYETSMYWTGHSMAIYVYLFIVDTGVIMVTSPPYFYFRWSAINSYYLLAPVVWQRRPQAIYYKLYAKPKADNKSTTNQTDGVWA